MDHRRVRLNPVEELARRGWPASHVTFDPKLKRGVYYIRRVHSHDGTLLFRLQLIGECLEIIARQDSYYIPDNPDFNKIISISYRVGWMRLAAVFGRVDLPIGRYPGQRESIKMWVVPTYHYREEAG